MEGLFIFLTVFSVAVVLPLALVKMILDYRRSRHLPSGVDDSIALSELAAMIDESVEKSTKPLIRRIDRLEKQLALLPPAQTDLSADIADLSEVESD